MVDRIVDGSSVRDPFVFDAKQVGHLLDLGGTSRQSDQPWMNGMEPFGKTQRRITLGINSNEYGPHSALVAVQKVYGGGDALDIHGAYVGAISVTEVDQQNLTAKFRVANPPPSMIGEREWPSEFRGLRNLSIG